MKTKNIFKIEKQLKKILLLAMLLLFPQILFGQLFPNLGGQRAGTSAGQFLKIGMGARAVGMGEAYVALANDAEALYWNPAGLVLIEKPSVIFSYTNWLVGTQLQFIGATYKLDANNALGVAITYLSSDEMNETTEFQQLGTGRTFSYSDFLIGLTYARYMTNQFSFGFTTKFMQETVFDLTMRAVLFDLGIYYDVGWGSTRFAVVMSNFGQDMRPTGSFKVQTLDNEFKKVDSFQSFPPPILLRIGIAGEIYEDESHKITASVQLSHPNDNTENLNFGLEYWLFNKFALRAGFKTIREEEKYSVGFGLKLPISVADFRLDYALTDFGRLGFVNRLAVQFQL
jgi:type IX secretion system protein PorV